MNASPDEVLILTDDELAALARAVARPWLRPLMTIPADHSELARAEARGFRSLELRGLISTEGSATPMLDRVAGLAGEQPVLVAVEVDEELGWRVDAERVELFADSEGAPAMACVSTAAGVHAFATADFKPAAEGFAEFLAPPAPDLPTRVAVLVRDRGGRHLDSYLCTGNGVYVMEPGVGGRMPPRPVRAVDWALVLDRIDAGPGPEGALQ